MKRCIITYTSAKKYNEYIIIFLLRLKIIIKFLQSLILFVFALLMEVSKLTNIPKNNFGPFGRFGSPFGLGFITLLNFLSFFLGFQEFRVSLLLMDTFLLISLERKERATSPIFEITKVFSMAITR